MRIPIFLFSTFLLACSVALSQPSKTSGGNFPDLTGFPELRGVLSEKSVNDPAGLSSIEDGRLFSDVGFERYVRRTYSGDAGEISVAIATLMDFRAAYSLLTQRSDSGVREGPPGDAFAAGPASVNFFQGRRWVQITGRKAPASLLYRLALAVSENLGPPGQKPPSLIGHLPASGYDAASLKYFPGLKSFESYSGSSAFKALRLNFDAEIAQARYTVDTGTGVLTLLNFPTPEVGEEYFGELSLALSGETLPEKTYLKRAGPLVAVFRGQLDPAAADRVLGSISHSYAVRWIFEKPKRKGVTWGVPVRVLHTVVKSILFVALLCVLAVIAGGGVAFVRYLKRRRAVQDGSDQNDHIWLRLR